jgi:hypothetical protein
MWLLQDSALCQLAPRESAGEGRASQHSASLSTESASLLVRCIIQTTTAVFVAGQDFGCSVTNSCNSC